ncbi:MAG: hypothetical protein V4507_09475 [Verrucomicrobiota bacterium]
MTLLLISIHVEAQIPSDPRIVLVSDAGTKNDIDGWYPLAAEKPDWLKIPEDDVAQSNLIFSIARSGALGVFVVGDEPAYQSPIIRGKLDRTGNIFHVNESGPLLLHGKYDIQEGKRWCPIFKTVNGQTCFNAGIWAARALGLKTEKEEGFDFIPSTRRYTVVSYEQWVQKAWWENGGGKTFEGKLVVLGDLNVNKKEELTWKQEKRVAEAKFGMDSSEGRLIKNSVLVADLIGSALWKYEHPSEK